MKSLGKKCRELLLAASLAGVATLPEVSSGQPAASTEIRIVAIEGVVEVSPRNATTWVPTTVTNLALNPYDRVRTGRNSRMTLRWSDKSVVPVSALTELQILPPREPKAESGLHLFRGILSFFHRDQPGRIRVITSGAEAGVEGTEFVLAVDTSGPTEITTMSVIDGTVRFYNNHGSLILTNLQRAAVQTGAAPVRTPAFVANNVLQWCFYYPAVLDLHELPLTKEEETALGASLRAYRAGDLLAALHNYPAGRQPGSDAERLYYAALLLSVGQVEETENALSLLSTAAPTERIQRLATALRQLIAAVKREANPSTVPPQLSTELMAASYYEQSLAHRETSLRTALDLARRAATNSPDFGFAWERVAELEFSFGRTDRALEALDRSLALSPRNAQAFVLKGFLLAAENKESEATWWFEDALTLDPSLGNAWLGRGLCRIRRGNLIEGREDLLVAAAIEPQRALLRDYLGKAYAEEGDYPRAAKELEIAKRLDKNDPTAWLYSALLNQQYNRINEAIRDLERSQELNDNRSVYRSSLLLDQDRAVRSANLAGIYRDAGMFDQSVREASRAVSYDYANYSAHLFLANSYDELRDPNRINLRFETAAESEYLMANLLSPAAAGTLSQPVSQQDYTKLFQRDRLGLSSFTEYLSRGAWTENGAQYGTFGNSSYSLAANYHSDPGQHSNGDFEERILSAEFKQQLTPKDTAFFQAIDYQASGGDPGLFYDPTQPFPQGPNPELRTRETQEPILALGYHHEWAPGMHTIVLGTRLTDRISVDNPAQISLLVDRTPDGLDYVEPFLISQTYQSDLKIYTAEVQQIWQVDRHLTILGALYQNGNFDTKNLQLGPYGTENSQFITPTPDTPAQDANFVVDFERVTFYGYHQWQIFDPLYLVGGISYDKVKFPTNFRAAPISSQQQTEDLIAPKAGIIWTPWTNGVLRGAYTRSLSGASIDQTFRLEPTQVAGFLQSFRSVTPESIGGAKAGATFDTYAAAFEQKFSTGTYLGLTAELLKSEVERALGEFEFNPNPGEPAFVGATPDKINYQEKSLLLTVNQLLGDAWSLGALYRLSRADLWESYPEVLPVVDAQDPALLKGFRRNQHLDAILHELLLYGIYNHPSGFFGRFEAVWYSQSNGGYAVELAGDNFWQLNGFIGYRFPRRKAELEIGLLNLTDQDYRLNPLNLYNELPRNRTFVARLRLSF
jgi:Tfp pilus assembly protein PilF